MTVTDRVEQGVTIVAIEGELDGKSAPEAQQAIVPLVPADGKLLIDMHGVPYMSSAGLRMMLLLYRQAVAKGSVVALVGLSEEIEDTMSATGFLDFFTVVGSVASGIDLLNA